MILHITIIMVKESITVAIRPLLDTAKVAATIIGL